MSTPGHKGFEVNEDDAIQSRPDSLYMLLMLVFGGQDTLDGLSSEHEETNIRIKVFSIA